MNGKSMLLARSYVVFLGFVICTIVILGCDLGNNTTKPEEPPDWPSYTVSYRANGGIGSMRPSVHKHGDNPPLNENAFSREGYTFSGWARTPTGALEFDDSQEVENLSQREGATVQLFAVWKPNTYTVVYNGNGGTGTMFPSDFTYDKPGALDAVRFSHTDAEEKFLGWARTPGGNIAFRDRATILNITAINEDVIRLYAGWGSGTYEVTFDINEGTGITPDAQTVNAGVTIRLPDESGFSKPGLAFVWWNTRADGTGDNFNAGAYFTPIQDVTLYARYALAFEVEFDANGGTAQGTGTVPSAIMVRNGTSITLPGGGNLIKSGDYFAGWNTAADGSGSNYSAGAQFTPKADTTLFAKWIEVGAGNSYRVAFDINGGTGITPNPQNPAEGADITLPSNGAFSRQGFAFAGWSTNNDDTGTTYSAGDPFTPTASVTLYARWIPNFTVRFILNGGTGTTPPVQMVNRDSSITLPGGAGITKSGGFRFGGWNTRADGTGTNYTAGTLFTPKTSIDLYVLWVDDGNAAIGSSLADQLSWVQSNAVSGGFYTVNVRADEAIAPHSLSFTNRTNITVTLKGEGSRKNIRLTSDGAVFTVYPDITLILGENITLNGRSGNTNAVVRVNSGGTLVMNAGARITGNANGTTIPTYYGGGVNNAGTFTMNGGEISGNRALDSLDGGGVYNSGTFTINGGEISNNSARDGGGVQHSSGTLTINGGKIADNTARANGGGVRSSSTINLNDGEISGNTAFGNGGGVYDTTTSARFNMRGGSISGNHASGTQGGGGVWTNSGNFRMSGGVIYGIERPAKTKEPDDDDEEDEEDEEPEDLEEPEELKNTGTNAALYRGANNGAQYGIFSGTNFTSSGNLPNSRTTIRVVNGDLQ